VLINGIVKALREIKHAQKDVGLIIPHQAMRRLCREIVADCKSNFHIGADACNALHEAAEMMLTCEFDSKKFPSLILIYN
jgi:histone H3/H4